MQHVKAESVACRYPGVWVCRTSTSTRCYIVKDGKVSAEVLGVEAGREVAATVAWLRNERVFFVETPK